MRHVERSIGVKLDYQPETLPILDHYIGEARAEAKSKPEIFSILVQTAGAYLGEVIRRRHASWWRLEGSDPSDWQLELEDVYLAVSPVRLIIDALLRGAPGVLSDDEQTRDEQDVTGGDLEAADISALELEEEDHASVSARLAELPPVPVEEFYAPSTRVEVIDIAVEAIRARRMAEGEEIERKLRPEDYKRDG